MIRGLAMLLVVVGVSTPAAATEWINCADAQGQASFDMLVGALDVLAIVGLTVSVGEQVWASDTAYGPGAPIAVGQAFEDSDSLVVDAMDDNLMARIAELRLFKATDDTGAMVYGGTLRIPGHGAWAVSCSGP